MSLEEKTIKVLNDFKKKNLNSIIQEVKKGSIDVDLIVYSAPDAFYKIILDKKPSGNDKKDLSLNFYKKVILKTKEWNEKYDSLHWKKENDEYRDYLSEYFRLAYLFNPGVYDNFLKRERS